MGFMTVFYLWWGFCWIFGYGMPMYSFFRGFDPNMKRGWKFKLAMLGIAAFMFSLPCIMIRAMG